MSESSVAGIGGSDPSARITRVMTPVASPGTCVICGKNEHPDGFAATDNLDFEFYGSVYFCADCVGDYARLFGYLSPNDYAQMREHVAAQEVELATLRAAILGMEATVDGLVADAHRRISTRALDVRNERDSRDAAERSVSDSVDEPNAGPTDANSNVPVIESRVDASGPSQSVDEQGRDDLHDTSSADELLGLN